MFSTRHVFPGALVAAAIAILAPSVPAAVECSADVRATLARDNVLSDVVEKVFAVEIDTKVDCAKVYVDLTVTEQLFNGEEITTTSRGWRKVTTHSTYKVNHRIAKDSTLSDWKFQVARCVVCGTE